MVVADTVLAVRLERSRTDGRANHWNEAFLKEIMMVRIVKSDQRDFKLFDTPGATVQVSDPVVGKEGCLSAGFTEYIKPSRLEWTFDYNEVFFMLEGALEVHAAGQDPVAFEAGDLGYIEKGTKTTIVVSERACLLHVTQPAWGSSPNHDLI